MNVNKLITPYNKEDGNAKRIKYLVIHYVGAEGDAEANCKYYASKYIGASAHYFVGFHGDVWQSVEDKDIAWHCGAKSYKHPECRNSNSIGIELCVKNKGNKSDDSRDWYFEKATVQAATELTKELMQKYSVPAENILRHYDVTGKICPNPFVYNHTQFTWIIFKASLQSQPTEDEGFILAADGKRWWYRFKDRSYAQNGWYWLKESATGSAGWYLFDGEGYMLTGFHRDTAGEPFLLCPDKGVNEGKCMVSDKRGVLMIVNQYDFEKHQYIM